MVVAAWIAASFSDVQDLGFSIAKRQKSKLRCLGPVQVQFRARLRLDKLPLQRQRVAKFLANFWRKMLTGFGIARSVICCAGQIAALFHAFAGSGSI